MKHVVSLSGGRTSTGPLPLSVIKEFGKENVDFVFCDTGAEDDDTYRFIRDSEKFLGVKITCLKLIMPKEKGKGCQYIVTSTGEICRDHFAWRQLTSKYGNPYIPGGKFCTNEMKAEIFKRYCNNRYGKRGFYTWIGYRVEEGNRIWGRNASNTLGKLGMDNTQKTEFYLDCLKGKTDLMLEEYFPSMFPNKDDEKKKRYIKKAIETIKNKKF